LLLNKLEQDLEHLVPTHPFSEEIKEVHLEPLLANYLAMSMAFPYIQAGSCSDAILACINNNREMPQDFETSSIVASFLVWDELGGWYKTYKKGNAALPSILDGKAVHANFLKGDLEKLFGHYVTMRFDTPTKNYLLELYKALSSSNVATRCAAMVTFEIHAERMINSLWQTVAKIFNVQKDTLQYFSTHVGGDDPAEAHHVAMTQNMLNALISPSMFERFRAESFRLYLMHTQWCSEISCL
jgi:hypothetical protein